MARQQDTPPSRRQPPAPNSVNKFAPGPFLGDGRRRSPDLSRAARDRRERSAEIAALLVVGGLDPTAVYRAASGVVDTAVALDDSGLADDLGRPRSRWQGFPDDAHRAKTQRGREYGAFCAERGIECAVQVVVRPPESDIDLVNYRSWHARQSEKLGELLRSARGHRAPGLRVDLIGAEVRNRGAGGWRIDAHFHIAVRSADYAELADLTAFFEERGWTFWVTDEDEAAEHHPIALAQYEGKGLAAAIKDSDEWDPAALAELRRQTHGLALVRAAGEFRRWLSERRQAGEVIVEDAAGRPQIAPRPTPGPRLRRRLRADSSIVALGWCVHDFGDGLARRALRVRGRPGVTLVDVVAVYDLDGVLSSSKESAAIPESIPAQPWPPNPPPPINSSTDWGSGIPW